MESLGKLQLRQQPNRLFFTPLSSSFPKSLSSISFRSLPRSTPSFKCASIKASSSRSQDPRLSVLKSTCVSFTAAAALFLVNLQLKPQPAIAAPVTAATPSMESLKQRNGDVSLEEEEISLEALRSLMEVMIKYRKFLDALELVDRFFKLDRDDNEWRMLKACYSGDIESAKSRFEEIIAKDPLCVEAYHGLVMAYSDSGADLNAVEKRTKEAMVRCKKEKNRKDLRDFKLLVAQIRVIEGKHKEALKLYEELVKKEPRDFRPYLCQGIIYTVLKKQAEAEKQFEKFRQLVPMNHPYRKYLTDNVVDMKLFAEKAQREMGG